MIQSRGWFEVNGKYLRGQTLKRITFKKWVNAYGVEKLAGALVVSPGTVRHWRVGCRLPRALEMDGIFKLSGGRVTANQMIKAHLEWVAKQ